MICKTASGDSFQALSYMLAEHRLGGGGNQKMKNEKRSKEFLVDRMEEF